MQLAILTCVLIATFVQNGVADIRYESKEENGFKYRQKNVPTNTDANGNEVDGPNNGVLRYRVPSTFGYKKLENQKKNKNDQFLRSNIDNEANQRNTEKEPAMDMTPCRQPEGDTQEVMQWRLGETVQLPIRWNNPHDSSCEINLWNSDISKVAPIRTPFKCGGGYQDARFEVTIPKDVPGCVNEQCILQFYAHSVETRTYAVCINFKIIPETAAARRLRQAQVETKCVAETAFQDPVYYWDSYDTSHVDSDYSGYRGQQIGGVRDEVKAAIKLYSYVGNGGLIKLDDPKQNDRNNMKNKVKKAIKDAEKIAIKANKEEQKKLDKIAKDTNQPKECFEGEMYGVTNNKNCKRQYNNTYVTNVNYRKIMDEFKPKFAEKGLTPYSPKLKTAADRLSTPEDPDGQYKVNGKPSKTPKN